MSMSNYRTIILSSTDSMHDKTVYSVSQEKVASLKLFAIFSFVVNLCNWITVAIAQTYFYVYINFGPFIWIFVWIVSFLL